MERESLLSAEQSAYLKERLKHEPWSLALNNDAEAHPVEADEAYDDVLNGVDTCRPDSWVGRERVREGLPNV